MKLKARIYPVWDPWGGNPPEFEDVYTSISIDRLDFDKSADKKILYLAEPFEILPAIKKKALTNGDNFDIIYTTDQDIIDKYKQAILFEFGTSWLDFKTLNITKKNHITFITSSKSITAGHRLRKQTYNMLKDRTCYNNFIYIAHKSPPYHSNRNDFFETSMFHIAIENCSQRNFFSEKLIDCFASKTIPIYYGCPNLEDWFDMSAVITFSNIRELKIILDKLDQTFYTSRQQAINHNYEYAKKFHSQNDIVERLTNRIAMDIYI